MPALSPEQAFHLALERARGGCWGETATICAELLRTYPSDPEVLHLRGLAAFFTGQHETALRSIQQAIAVRPDVARYQNNLAAVLDELHRPAEAEAACARAMALDPTYADPYSTRGNVRMHQRQWDAAIEDYRAALKLRPDLVQAILNLGSTLAASGRVEAAIAHFESCAQRFPKDAAIRSNLGGILLDAGRLNEAIAAFRAVLAIAPDHWVANNNLGNALKEQGSIDGAIQAYRRSLALHPQAAEVHSNLIFAMHFDPASGPEDIRREMREWQVRQAAPLRAQWRPHGNDRSPGRRLRIGYVSPDFRDHVVGRALLPVLEVHDRENFEWFCYALAAPDHATARFQSLAGHWRDASLWSSEKLAAQIRADGIDVLVDLALHTAFNQLPAFARKPAPVQLSWLGYPGATGLEAMDCRITDRFLDPAETDAPDPFEIPVRLPDCWSVYQPPTGSPEPGEPPSARTGHLTFGSFNSFAKINDRVLGLWCRILAAIEGSHLRLLAKTGDHHDRTRRFFHDRGIAAERIEIATYEPPSPEASPADYLRRYQEIDIALDPFPYNGMTTTCDALWMGVPVVALTGSTPVSRASFSLLSNVGLPELAAASEGEYVRLATELAGDIPRLVGMRATLRGRMKSSPLLDAPRFARNLEAAFRGIWVERVSARAFGA